MWELLWAGRAAGGDLTCYAPGEICPPFLALNPGEDIGLQDPCVLCLP